MSATHNTAGSQLYQTTNHINFEESLSNFKIAATGQAKNSKKLSNKKLNSEKVLQEQSSAREVILSKRSPQKSASENSDIGQLSSPLTAKEVTIPIVQSFLKESAQSKMNVLPSYEQTKTNVSKKDRRTYTSNFPGSSQINSGQNGGRRYQRTAQKCKFTSKFLTSDLNADMKALFQQ